MQYFVRTVRLVVLLGMMTVTGHAGAIIRSPFPSRPLPPYQGRYISIASDWLTFAPKAVKPPPAR